ncbi:HD-GYP domain-containing protein [Paenibacillus aestuarii]|uniref:HD-GYP domain-containing protein n=1 Tax=Paenibacillus aestuarii TaxID=516965 RepID=A0ABW0KCU9_9BACL|nr:HD-GYP domain-containing protein [Paenibacillus aestuarii]
MFKMFKEKAADYLSNTAVYRCSFFVMIIFLPILNLFILPNIDVYSLYLLSVIFLGIGFSHRPFILVLTVSTFVVLLRVYIQFHRLPSADLITLWIVYAVMTYLAYTMENLYQKKKKAALEVLLALSKLLDSRDTYTATHSENVAKYASMIAQEMKLSAKQCDIIYIGGLLHDIGKIGIPESVLTKSGRLTAEEYNTIKRHPKIGFEIIKHISAFRETHGVLDMVLYHHERYDGQGYPEGLKAQEIPLMARILSVADSYDAMTTKRAYRERMELEYVYQEFINNKGSQFDPKVVDAFLTILKKDHS